MHSVSKSALERLRLEFKGSEAEPPDAEFVAWGVCSQMRTQPKGACERVLLFRIVLFMVLYWSPPPSEITYALGYPGRHKYFCQKRKAPMARALSLNPNPGTYDVLFPLPDPQLLPSRPHVHPVLHQDLCNHLKVCACGGSALMTGLPYLAQKSRGKPLEDTHTHTRSIASCA